MKIATFLPILMSQSQLTINQQYWFMMTSSNGNIFRVTGHLCGEFTGPRWIPRTKASDADLDVFCARINGWVNNREAGDLRRYRTHYDVIVMMYKCRTGHCSVIMSRMASQITGDTIVHSTVQAQIKENTKAPRHWPLWGESTGDQWIPRSACNAENVSIWWRHHGRHAIIWTNDDVVYWGIYGSLGLINYIIHALNWLVLF